MSNTYDELDLIRVSATFRDQTGTLVDPSVVRFKYRKPDGVITSLTYLTDAALKRNSLGVYYVDLELTMDGTWRYRWQAEGAGQSAQENELIVRASVFS